MPDEQKVETGAQSLTAAAVATVRNPDNLLIIDDRLNRDIVAKFTTCVNPITTEYIMFTGSTEYDYNTVLGNNRYTYVGIVTYDPERVSDILENSSLRITEILNENGGTIDIIGCSMHHCNICIYNVVALITMRNQLNYCTNTDRFDWSVTVPDYTKKVQDWTTESLTTDRKYFVDLKTSKKSYNLQDLVPVFKADFEYI